MSENAKAMVLAAFAADSLALGVHWIYDAEMIKKSFGRVEAFLEPQTGVFHTTKGKGDFTHYGDQMFVLLESIGAQGGFNSPDFSRRWRDLFRDYQGYTDQATRITLGRYAEGFGENEAGSPSDDLAGASRMAPVVYAHRDDLEDLVKASRLQTELTHRDPLTLDSAEFFARVAWRVLQGTAPREALERVGEEHFGTSPIARLLKQGLDASGSDSVEAIVRFGQTCHTPEAFPGVIHLIATYEDNLQEALVQAVMAGGDSAARGMMAGMILGAHLGLEAIPGEWLSGMNKHGEITRLLDKAGV